MPNRIAIFASGSGSNAENIINYFSGRPDAVFPFILCNKKEAFVHERAKKLQIPSITFDKNQLENGEILALLQKEEIDFIVLAGFLLKIPESMIAAYPNKIVNIHPALLPDYGGKGMYGMKVHEAVVANNERESGITIHYVNERYDEGGIISQYKCEVLPGDSPENVAQKVHALEYEYFPKVIEELLNK
ncbi:MAG: phosphoribosylglycinamide formyltransferase [Prevotellaceae bacterium]|nr:phosphoribosylglycinamide formyltransferase [Prevotellaceae bacterium]